VSGWTWGWVVFGVLFVAAFALGVAACSAGPRVVTFTDSHGRVCTAVVTVEGLDRKAESVDCEYPPEGTEPGLSEWRELPPN